MSYGCATLSTRCGAATAAQGLDVHRADQTMAAIRNRACPKCNSTAPWGGASWCPACGYYPKLGRCVDLGTPPPGMAEELESNEPLEFPGWLILLGIGVLFILGVSIVARMFLPEDGPRILWALAQIGVGLLVFGVMHVHAYLFAGSVTDKLAPTDMFFHPILIWRPTLAALPETGKRVCGGAWGVSTALCAIWVVGLTLSQVGDVIAATAPKNQQPTMGAVINHLRSLNKDRPADDSAGEQQSLEDSVQALGGEIPEPLEESGDRQLMCVVFGYTQDVVGELHSVLIADLLEGKPHEFVGKIPVGDVDPKTVAYVDAARTVLATNRPCVFSPVRGHWLRPEIYCRIEYEEKTDEGYVDVRVKEVEDVSDEHDTTESGDAEPGAPEETREAVDGLQSSSSSSPSSP